MSTIYEFSVPVLVKGLRGLKTILEKAQTAGVDESVLLSDALAPDMFPFVKQVQIACDNAKGAVARLSGQEVPVHEDVETSLAELIARVEKTITYVESVTAAMLEDAHDRSVTLPYFPGLYMTGYDYLREFVLPNFFFHITTAYALVRRNGVTIGKSDYLAGLPLQPVQ
ncbi:MAG: hypothetical protein RLZZ70_626 [Candidatus Parcubacteria bacterium]